MSKNDEDQHGPVLVNCRHYAYRMSDAVVVKWWVRSLLRGSNKTADKLIMRDGNLYLNDGKKWRLKKQFINTTSSLMHELMRSERLLTSDHLVFHSQHEFVWHYLADTFPNLKGTQY